MSLKSRARVRKTGIGLKSIRTKGVYLASLPVPDRNALMELDKFHIDYACMPQQADGNRMQFYVSGSALKALQQSWPDVQILADAEAEGRKMQRLVGKGDRFKGGKSGPPGVGKLI